MEVFKLKTDIRLVLRSLFFPPLHYPLLYHKMYVQLYVLYCTVQQNGWKWTYFESSSGLTDDRTFSTSVSGTEGSVIFQ